MHKRQEIRTYVTDRLETISALAGKVFSSRVYSMGMDTMPGACVYTLQEENEFLTMGQRTQHRIMQLIIDIYHRGVDSQDLIDDIAESIEDELDLDIKFGGLVLESELINTSIDLGGEGAEPFAVMSMTYQITYIK